MDNNLAWMFQLLNYSKLNRLSVKRDYFREIGDDILLFNGVETWFDRMGRYAESSKMSCYMESIIDEIVAREKLSTEQKALAITAK